MRRAIFAACMAALVLGLSGCEKQGADVVSSETEIGVEVPAALGKFAEMSRGEFLAMSTEEFASMVTEAIPNYRTRYGIPDGVEMNDSEWEKLRSIMLVEMYGSSYESASEEVPSEAEAFAEYVGVDVKDPNWIYEAPSQDLILSMSTGEFREYLAGLYAYENPEATDVREFASALESVPDEDIEDMRDSFLVLIDEAIQ